MKTDRLERAIRAKEREEARKRNITDFFLDFSKLHRSWMQELADRYKWGMRDKTIVAPFIPMVILPSYYSNKRDMEIAAFAAMLIRDNGRYDDSVSSQLDNVIAFKEMLGYSPWEWFLRRGFVSLSTGEEQDKLTGGVENWKIAKLMDVLWHEQSDPIIKFGGIEETLRVLSYVQHCSYFDVLTYLLADCGIGQYFYKLRFLLMVLGAGDGFGFNIWEMPNERLLCPITDGVRYFLNTWFPDYKRIGWIDEAIRLFRLNGDCDFFYAWLGYKELQKRNPQGCSAYATAYLRWYGNGELKKPSKWRKVQPKIEF